MSLPTREMAVCRVCITGGRHLIPFARFDTARKPYRLAEAIAAVGGVPVENDDGMPQYCCVRCLRDVEAAYMVGQRVRESDRKLKEKLRRKEKPKAVAVGREVAAPLENVVEVKKEKESECETEQLIIKQETEESRLQETVETSSIKQEIENLQPLKDVKSQLQESVEVSSIKEEIEELQPFNEGATEELNKYVNVGSPLQLTSDDMEVDEDDGNDEEETVYDEQESNENYVEELLPAGEDTSRKARICCGCSQYFASQEELIAHSREIHYPERTARDDQRPFSCHICYKNLPNRNDLDDHGRRFREDLKKFPCRKCRKGFYSFQGLQAHRKCHSDEALHHKIQVSIEEAPRESRICCGCSQCFASSEELVAHSLNVHYPKRQRPDEKRPYACNICYQSLPNKNDLDDHERRFREDLKKYSCRICDKGFYNVKGLQIHEKCHGLVLNKCPMCPFVTMRLWLLRTHIARHSTPNGQCKCLLCGQSFNSPELLEKHGKFHKNKPLKCPHCPLVFNTKNWLAKHISKHVKEGTAVEYKQLSLLH